MQAIYSIVTTTKKNTLVQFYESRKFSVMDVRCEKKSWFNDPFSIWNIIEEKKFVYLKWKKCMLSEPNIFLVELMFC